MRLYVIWSYGGTVESATHISCISSQELLRERCNYIGSSLCVRGIKTRDNNSREIMEEGSFNRGDKRKR